MPATTTPILDDAERARRADFIRESRAAVYQGVSFQQRNQNREAKADSWAAWLRDKMASTGCRDPAELLPDICARLEQLSQDYAIAAVREIKAKLKEALNE
jgi:hypothetical protein